MMKWHIYFNGLYQDSFYSMQDVLANLDEWLCELVSISMCEPITVVQF